MVPPVAVKAYILISLLVNPIASIWANWSLYFSSGGLLSCYWAPNPPNPAPPKPAPPKPAPPNN